MIYLSKDEQAALAMEADRTGNYGDCYDDDIQECPVCGALYPEKFYVNDDEECVGCDICVHAMYELF